MMDFIEKVASRYHLSFSTEAILFLITSLVFYFMLIRWLLGACVITKIKRTKKERKARQKEVEERTPRERLRAFIKWILCLCYTKEQKEKRVAYVAFVMLNYTYILLIFLYWITWFLTLVIPQLRVLCTFILHVRLYLCDGPVMITLMILFYSGYTKKL